jgi:uncharacterized protein YrrD
MPTQPEIIKHSDLLNQVVLDLNSLEEMGQIEVLWTYPKAHRVLGFICKSGWLGAKKTAFNLNQLDSVGSSVLVNSKPVETDAGKVRQIQSLISCEVWTEAGDRAGKITDYLFNLYTGDIQHYLFTSNGWRGVIDSVYLLPPNYILSLGNQRVLIPEGAIESFAVYREGLQGKFSKVTEMVNEEKARSLLDQAKVRAKSLSEQVKDRARAVAEQASQFVDELEEDFVPEPTPSQSNEPDPWDDWEVEANSTPESDDDLWDEWDEKKS